MAMPLIEKSDVRFRQPDALCYLREEFAAWMLSPSLDSWLLSCPPSGVEVLEAGVADESREESRVSVM
jgi:hypothetical protein